MADPLDGCSVEGCDGDPFDGGVLGDRGAFKGRPLCGPHYSKARRRGKTMGHSEANRDVAEPPHGSLARYRSRVWRCLCAECRRAAADEKAARVRS